jgi:glucose/arabinose dehydrogenase
MSRLVSRCWRSVLIQVSIVTAAVIPLMHVVAQESVVFDPDAFAIGLEPVASGFEQPVYVTGPADGTGRLFVVERAGSIRILDGSEVRPEPFLDITPFVESRSSEQGLLSIAFPPDFADSGMFYVCYTARSDEGVGDNTIARFQISPDDPDRADVSSGEVLIAIPDWRVNHNGGLLLFGPDGHLYAGLGDGGGGGDPEGNAQDPSTLLGSILRIDVSSPGERPYLIPADNPFASGEGGAPEVWAWGLRNPWRFSFDRANGDLFIGDVGQGAIEEINWLPAGAAGGVNFGWSILEGTACFRAEQCGTTGLTLPVAQYSHDFGCTVVGGYVYRGDREPDLRGVYLFADYCSGLVWGLGRDASGQWAVSPPRETGLRISSFGEDAAGEVYLVSYDGDIFRVTAGE